MQVAFGKNERSLIILGLIGFCVFIYLFPRLYPESSVNMKFSKSEIIESGTDFVKDLGYEVNREDLTIQLECDREQLRYLNRVFGSAETNRLIMESIPVFYWSLHWVSGEDTSSGLSFQLGSVDEKESARQFDRLLVDIRLNLDFQGRPIEFESQSAPKSEQDTVDSEITLRRLNKKAADACADKLMNSYKGYWSFAGRSERMVSAGPIHQYRWHRDERIGDEHVSLRINVFNGRVQNFRKSYVIPKPFSEQKKVRDSGGSTFILLFLFSFVMGIVYFVQRLRADLMDLKTAFFPCVLVVLGWLVVYLNETTQLSSENLLNVAVGFAITMPFIAGGIWGLFALGESLTREVWDSKLMAMDSIRKKIMVPVFGMALYRGVVLAFLGLGLISLVHYILVNLFGGYFYLGDSYENFWVSGLPSLYILGKSLLSSSFIIVTFCMFFMPLIQRKFNKMIVLLLLITLLWTMVAFPVPQVQPLLMKLILNGLLGLLFVGFFLKYDLITVFTGAIGVPVLFYGIAALFSGSTLLFIHGLVLFLLVALVLFISLIAFKGKVPEMEIVPYVPPYLKRIYEKERFHRELEIARNVQLKFLPRKTPDIQGVEIATLCLPAREVGGDYYDFIDLGQRKLGVAIGDVSGKGISAAFYMTLTKGFLQSQAKNIFSPRQILINMNTLFYENVERGVFISMIYGIFDLDAKTLTFARAGHNPMILRRPGKGQAEELSPPGIALGFERGTIFEKTIEERTIGIGSKDVFLFYTDGLNEAQNALHEEFGEERLRLLVEKHTNLPVEGILNKIQLDIQHFTTDAPQHDDMTAVVVRVV